MGAACADQEMIEFSQIPVAGRRRRKCARSWSDIILKDGTGLGHSPHLNSDNGPSTKGGSFTFTNDSK
jgi:hypothetical protein